MTATQTIEEIIVKYESYYMTIQKSQEHIPVGFDISIGIKKTPLKFGQSEEKLLEELES